jgi:hypothetical protein
MQALALLAKVSGNDTLAEPQLQPCVSISRDMRFSRHSVGEAFMAFGSRRAANPARHLLIRLPKRIFEGADFGLMIEIERVPRLTFLKAQRPLPGFDPFPQCFWTGQRSAAALPTLYGEAAGFPNSRS